MSVIIENLSIVYAHCPRLKRVHYQHLKIIVVHKRFPHSGPPTEKSIKIFFDSDITTPSAFISDPIEKFIVFTMFFSVFFFLYSSMFVGHFTATAMPPMPTTKETQTTWARHRLRRCALKRATFHQRLSRSQSSQPDRWAEPSWWVALPNVSHLISSWINQTWCFTWMPSHTGHTSDVDSSLESRIFHIFNANQPDRAHREGRSTESLWKTWPDKTRRMNSKQNATFFFCRCDAHRSNVTSVGSARTSDGKGYFSDRHSMERQNCTQMNCFSSQQRRLIVLKHKTDDYTARCHVDDGILTLNMHNELKTFHFSPQKNYSALSWWSICRRWERNEKPSSSTGNASSEFV